MHILRVGGRKVRSDTRLCIFGENMNGSKRGNDARKMCST